MAAATCVESCINTSTYVNTSHTIYLHNIAQMTLSRSEIRCIHVWLNCDEHCSKLERVSLFIGHYNLGEFKLQRNGNIWYFPPFENNWLPVHLLTKANLTIQLNLMSHHHFGTETNHTKIHISYEKRKSSNMNAEPILITLPTLYHALLFEDGELKPQCVPLCQHNSKLSLTPDNFDVICEYITRSFFCKIKQRHVKTSKHPKPALSQEDIMSIEFPESVFSLDTCTRPLRAQEMLLRVLRHPAVPEYIKLKLRFFL